MTHDISLDSTVTVPPLAREAQPALYRGRATAGWATVAPPRKPAGEQRLLLAVLEDGLRILLHPRSHARGRGPRLEELDWISSDDRRSPFAFLSICETLDIDPVRLRRRVYDACRVAGILMLLLALAVGTPAAHADTTVAASAQVGAASWYGPGFAFRPTASGVPFDPARLTAAHRTLSLGTRLRVTNLQNGRSVDVEVNDRGRYVKSRDLDLSLGAARCLGMVKRGVAKVRMEVL